MNYGSAKTIRRRPITIYPQQGQELTNCNIKLSSWLLNRDLSNIKMRISSFYLNNTTMPCFKPLWTPDVKDVGDFTNKNNTDYISSYIPNGNLFNADILNYWVAIKNTVPALNQVKVSYVFMNSMISEYPLLKPPIHPSNASNQYTNRYYDFFNTTKFCELVTQALLNIASDYALTPKIEITKKVGGGYTLFVEKTFIDTGFEIEFSPSLNDLFQFKSEESPESTNLRTIIFNSSPVTYISTQMYTVVSRYVPDTWFPFNAVLITTSSQIENEIFYDNSNFIAQGYDDIMVTFFLSINDPDSVYNFFRSDFSPDENWCTVKNSNSGQNLTFSIKLRLKYDGSLFNFTIGQGEQANFIIEEIDYN